MNKKNVVFIQQSISEASLHYVHFHVIYFLKVAMMYKKSYITQKLTWEADKVTHLSSWAVFMVAKA